MKRIMGVLAMTALVGITLTATAHEHATPAAKTPPPVTKADLPPAPPKAAVTAKPAAPAPNAVVPAKPTVMPASITGEIVDAGCYLGHGERGAKHAQCAKQCIAGGMPMCLVTSTGAVYMLTMNHENPDPYNKLKTMAGRTVTVTGSMMERGGMKAIDVASMKPLVSQAKPVKREAAKTG